MTAEGNKVVFEFTGNAAPKYDGIISTKILPEHVYSKVGDPTKYVDKTPVSTGPFKVGSYNGRQLVLERRADYWQADKIKVQKLVLEGNYDALQAALKLRSGQLDAYWGEIPNPKKTFVDADPKNNHFYYAPNGMTVLTGNDEKAPFNDAEVPRGDLATRWTSRSMSLKATYGIMKPASQTGLKLPSMQNLLPDKYAGEDTVLPYDVAKANQLLDAAGYKKGADGKRTNPDGSPAGGELLGAGRLHRLPGDRRRGRQGPQRRRRQRQGHRLRPRLGRRAEEDRRLPADARVPARRLRARQEHRRQAVEQADPDEDRHLPQRRALQATRPSTRPSTKLAADTDQARARRSTSAPLVDTMMTKYPVTALIYAPARIIYRTDKAVGWPSEQDPYANPQDDKLLVLTHLTAPK